MKRTSLGFSLVELMVALTILGILTAIATPTFREYTRNTRVSSAQNDLATALNLARSESMRRSRPVTVCASADGLACGGAPEWAQGWIAFTDRLGADAGDFTEGDDELLQKWEAPSGDVVVQGDQTFVQFLPTGVTAGGLNLSVTATGCKGQNKRSLQVTETGALFAKKVNCT